MCLFLFACVSLSSLCVSKSAYVCLCVICTFYDNAATWQDCSHTAAILILHWWWCSLIGLIVILFSQNGNLIPWFNEYEILTEPNHNRTTLVLFAGGKYWYPIWMIWIIIWCRIWHLSLHLHGWFPYTQLIKELLLTLKSDESWKGCWVKVKTLLNLPYVDLKFVQDTIGCQLGFNHFV